MGPDVDFADVAAIIRHHGAHNPEREAVRFEGRVQTYGELDARSSQAAQALISLGVQPGDRVGFFDKNRPEYLEILFGAAKLGATVTALNWRLAPEEIRAIAADAAPSVLIVGQELHGVVESIEANLDPATRCLTLDRHPRWPSFTDLVAVQAAEDPGYAAEPDDVAFQLYTSGTSGRPKGVLTTVRGIRDGLLKVMPIWQFDETAVVLAPNPVFHVAGTSWVLVALAAGATVVLQREIRPGEIIAAIENEAITNVVLLPAVLQAVLSLPEAATADLSSLRFVLYGSAPIAPEVLAIAIERLRCDFVQQYGMTESTGPLTCLMPEDHDPGNPGRLLSCGQPVPWAEVAIFDTTTGQALDAGQVGEIWTRSSQNAAGYWNNPIGTAELLDPDGWMHTGDAGYFHDDGYLFLTDRVKDMIVTGSENVYTAEVEKALAGHPAIAEIAVIGVPDPQWGEAVKAVVVLAEGSTLTVEELRTHGRGHLAGYKLPKTLDLVDALPRNASGKVLKHVLREPYWRDTARGIA